MSVWEDLLEVIVVGSIAGVGLSVAFAWMLRSIMSVGDARREGRGSAVAGHLVVAIFTGVICLGAVAFALYSMIHH